MQSKTSTEQGQKQRKFFPPNKPGESSNLLKNPKTKKKKPELVTCSKSFHHFLQDHCPVVTETYYPTVWCWEGRVQTLLRPLITSRPYVQYRNELIKATDGGQISLDWFDNNDSMCYPDSSTRPTILLLPGLTGSSRESYILHMIQQSKELGYRCVVFNYRGTAGENLLTPRTYCASNTEDLEAVIHHIHSLYSSASFMAAGVSMGGMLLVNYLGKVDTKTPLKAAAVFSAGWNVFDSIDSLEKPVNWLLFNYYLTSCLQSSVIRLRASGSLINNSLQSFLAILRLMITMQMLVHFVDWRQLEFQCCV